MKRIQEIGRRLRPQKAGVFGRALADFPAKELMEGIPLPVYRCVEYICRTDSLATEGIFRLSPSHLEVSMLKDLYDSGKDPDLNVKCTSPHTAAGLLKLFFRKMPEPLLTFELYDCFMAANAINVEGPRRDCFHRLVHFLPSEHYTVLVYLVKFLRLVTEYKDQNRMGPSNLGMIFAPNLLRSEDAEVDVLAQSMEGAKVLNSFIVDFDVIFADAVATKFDFEYLARGEAVPESLGPLEADEDDDEGGDLENDENQQSLAGPPRPIEKSAETVAPVRPPKPTRATGADVSAPAAGPSTLVSTSAPAVFSGSATPAASTTSGPPAKPPLPASSATPTPPPKPDRTARGADGDRPPLAPSGGDGGAAPAGEPLRKPLTGQAVPKELRPMSRYMPPVQKPGENELSEFSKQMRRIGAAATAPTTVPRAMDDSGLPSSSSSTANWSSVSPPPRPAKLPPPVPLTKTAVASVPGDAAKPADATSTAERPAAPPKPQKLAPPPTTAAVVGGSLAPSRPAPAARSAADGGTSTEAAASVVASPEAAAVAAPPKPKKPSPMAAAIALGRVDPETAAVSSAPLVPTGAVRPSAPPKPSLTPSLQASALSGRTQSEGAPVRPAPAAEPARQPPVLDRSTGVAPPTRPQQQQQQQPQQPPSGDNAGATYFSATPGAGARDAATGSAARPPPPKPEKRAIAPAVDDPTSKGLPANSLAAAHPTPPSVQAKLAPLPDTRSPRPPNSSPAAAVFPAAAPAPAATSTTGTRSAPTTPGGAPAPSSTAAAASSPGSPLPPPKPPKPERRAGTVPNPTTPPPL